MERCDKDYTSPNDTVLDLSELRVVEDDKTIIIPKTELAGKRIGSFSEEDKKISKSAFFPIHTMLQKDSS